MPGPSPKRLCMLRDVSGVRIKSNKSDGESRSVERESLYPSPRMRKNAFFA
jgi:hypothetical protein